MNRDKQTDLNASDLRLAARLARFAAERGGLTQEETNGKA